MTAPDAKEIADVAAAVACLSRTTDLRLRSQDNGGRIPGGGEDEPTCLPFSVSLQCSPVALACLDCYWRDAKTLEITRVNTPKAFRGLGIASALLRACLRRCDAAGVTAVLYVSPSDGLTEGELCAWYWRHGFRSRTIYLGVGDDTALEIWERRPSSDATALGMES